MRDSSRNGRITVKGGVLQTPRMQVNSERLLCSETGRDIQLRSLQCSA
jgi:hypothetical protein